IILRRPQDGMTLTENDDRLMAILKRLKADPKYKAYIQLNFTLTHSPYSWYSNSTTTQAFCQDFPEECKRITFEDIKKYLPIHEKNYGDLSYHFDETVKRLGLAPQDVSKMAAVLEVAYKSCVHRLDDRFGATISAIQKAGIFDQSLVVFTADHGEILY